MNLRDKGVLFLATGFYVGNVPFAPGTFGTILGLPLCFALAGLRFPLAIGGTVLFIVAAVWIANGAEKLLGKKDPGSVVIDEVAGMAVTLAGLPFNLITALVGFIVFRILDILKPFPIRNLDKRISGGLGIVLDDVVAGIFANLLLRVVIYFFLKTI